MRRIVPILISLLLCVGVVHASTQRIQKDELYYFIDTETLTAEVTYETLANDCADNYKDLTVLIIPESFEWEGQTYSVTAIGYDAFHGYSGYSDSLTLPNSIIIIRDRAFYGCSGLTGSLTLPNSITSIGQFAFNGCSELTGVFISDLEAWCKINFGNFTANPLYYAEHLYLNGKELTELVIPDTLTEIKKFTFYKCKSFNGSLTLPSSIKSIGAYAFGYCSGLTGVYISDLEAWCKIDFGGFDSNPLEYAEHLYLNGQELTELNLPESLTEIKDFTFRNCKSFTGSFTLPSSITSIGSYAFYGCSGFTGSLTLQDSIISIGSYAFYNCSGFTGSLTLPNSITSIESNTFYYCSGFTGGLHLPNSITSIGKSAFRGCSGFTGPLTLPNSIKTIESHAFYNCKGFDGTLTLPNSITSIGSYAFENCSRFTGDLILPSSLQEISHWAFYNCQFPNIYSHSVEPPVYVYDTNNNYTIFSDAVYQNSVLYVPENAVDGYKSADGWSQFVNINPISDGNITASVNVDDFSLTAGETVVVPLNIESSEPFDYAGFQFDIKMPEGLTLDAITLNDELASAGFTGSSNLLNDGVTTRYICHDQTLKGSNLSEGIVTLTISAAPTASAGNVTVNFTNAMASTKDGLDIILNDSETEVNVIVATLTIKGEKHIIKTTEKLQLTAEVIEEGVELPELVWTSSNPEYASVDSKSGLVTGLSAGTTTITATAVNNSYITADFEVTVEDRLLGDANDNGFVTVGDVVTTANHIIEVEVPRFSFVNADSDEDGNIDQNDIVTTVNIILTDEDYHPHAIKGKYHAPSQYEDNLVSDNFKPEDGKTMNIGVKLDNTQNYVALQANIVVPEGMKISEVTPGPRLASHSLMYNIKDDGNVKVVIFSLNNSAFADNKDLDLFNITASASHDCGNLTIDNIIGSDDLFNEYMLGFNGGYNEALVTGINDAFSTDTMIKVSGNSVSVINAAGMELNIYSVDGVHVASIKCASDFETYTLNKGVYVITIGNNHYKININ